MHAVDMVAAARQIDDARGLPPFDQGHQQIGQQEMTDMVGAKLHFETVGGAIERGSHHPGIVDQQVDLVEAIGGILGCRAHTVERGEVADERVHPRAGSLGNLVGDSGQLGRIAPSQDDMRALGRHRPRGFLPEPRISARDQRGAPVQIAVCKDLVGRAFEPELAHTLSPFARRRSTEKRARDD